MHIIHINEDVIAPGIPLVAVDMRQKKLEMHTHDCVELVIVHDGHGTHLTLTGNHPVSPGDVLIIHPGMAHGYENTGDGFYITNILFKLERLSLPLQDIYKQPGYNMLFGMVGDYYRHNRIYPHFRVPPKTFEKISTIARMMSEEYANVHQGGIRCCLTGYLMIVLAHVSMAYSDLNRPEKGTAAGIGRVLRYMGEHFTEKFDMEALVRISAMSKSGLMYYFRKETGASPLQYMVRLRIALACRMLQSGSNNITEIALNCGFNDSSHFIKTFRKIVGKTPGQYKKHATELPEQLSGVIPLFRREESP